MAFLSFVAFLLICTIIGIIASIRQKVLIYSGGANLLYCVIPAFVGAFFLFMFLLVSFEGFRGANEFLFQASLGLFAFFSFFVATNAAKYNNGFFTIIIVSITAIVIAWPVVLLRTSFFSQITDFLFTYEYDEYEEYDEEKSQEEAK
ncbi:hypothetical protein [Campylobacter majalis]|uniref:hypothetical protein n=1 Tax=Campylobacter majalis TaxID=2790656 RepID=UPI003D69EC2F